MNRILMLNDESSAIILEALRKFDAALKAFQNTRVAIREISLRKDDMPTVRQIEEVMIVSDRQIEVTEALIKSIEEV